MISKNYPATIQTLPTSPATTTCPQPSNQTQATYTQTRSKALAPFQKHTNPLIKKIQSTPIGPPKKLQSPPSKPTTHRPSTTSKKTCKDLPKDERSYSMEKSPKTLSYHIQRNKLKIDKIEKRIRSAKQENGSSFYRNINDSYNLINNFTNNPKILLSNNIPINTKLVNADYANEILNSREKNRRRINIIDKLQKNDSTISNKSNKQN